MTSTKQNNTVLWWAALGFTLLLSAWTVFFVVATQHRVAEVPLATPSRPQ